MELSHWLLIATVCALGAMSPGPSSLVVIQQTISLGRAYGIATGLAHAGGIGIYAVVTVAGLGVASRLPWLLSGLRWAGVIFLLYIAIQLLRSSVGATHPPKPIQTSFPLRHSLRNGFLIAFLNPKVLLFFTALFSQFLRPAFTWWEKSIMVLTAITIDAGWYMLLAVGVSHPVILGGFRKHESTINRGFGVLLILVAARLVFS